MTIDARGCSCPEPVLMAKKGLDSSPEGIEVLVDNNTARENVTRFAKSRGYQVSVEELDGDFVLKLSK